MAKRREHIVIIGAGVIGLTTAVFLAEEGHKVTVIAAHVPGDKSIEYTSPWAGAHWHTHATADTPRECDWDVQTYDYWLDLIAQEKKDSNLPKSGLKVYDSYKYWDFNLPMYENIWWAPYVKNFRSLSPDVETVRMINERAGKDGPQIIEACAFSAVSINVPQYLHYLQERARKAGARVIKQRLPVDEGLDTALAAAETIAKEAGRGKAAVFVNASGLGAAKLCGDEAMYPIRGQTVLVKGEAPSIFTRSGKEYGSYCIPRPGSGSTILGGTKEVGNWDETPDPAVTERILKSAALNMPELMTGKDCGFEIISVQCGLRPGRTGGPRLENEVLGSGRSVVHAYGHAGGGYQNSIGSARLALKLVREALDISKVGARL